jgi:hypothetical protein
MELPGVTSVRPSVDGVLQMVSKPTIECFTGVYGSVEKDMVAYKSGTWVCTHDA